MEYQMQNSADLLAQLNKLPSPSMVDPHNSTTTSESSVTYPNPFAEKNNNETNSTAPDDDKTIKSIMSMYPGSEPKAQEPTSWRPPNSGYPSLDQRLDSWPTYQVSPKPEAKSMASPVPSPIQSRPDTADAKSSETTPNYSAPQFPSYTSPKPEVRSETPPQPNYATSATSYRTNPTVPTTPTTPSYAATSPATPSYQSPQSTGYQLNSTTYQSPSQQQAQASTQYPLYQQQQPYSQSSSTTTAVQSPQLLLSQIEKLQQQNQQQQQAFQQHLQQQMQLQKQLSTIQQTEAVTKEFIDKMQTNFTKIMGFMESVDQRLSNLEKVTQSILHNQNNPSPVVTKTSTTTPVSTMPHPPPAISYPSYAVPLGPTYSNTGNSVYPTLQTADEADAVRKIEQFEEDQKLAKRLQEELEFEAKRTSTTSSSSSKSSTSTTKKSTPTPKKDDESAICPICSTQISLAEIESHADKCLESSSTTKKDSNGQPTPQEKAGFFAKLFGSKDTAATPTPAPPTPVATKPTTTPAPTKPTTTTTTTTAMQQPTTVAHMPTTMPTAFQPGPGNPNGQFYQMPYMYNTAYAPYGYSQYPPGTGQQQPGYYYYPGQQPPTNAQPKKN